MTFDDYPKAASNNAKKALDYREETENKNNCGTLVGWARANQLAKREPISLETVKRMAAFNRHRKNKDVPYDEGCGGLMWDAWGGTEGIDWAIKKSEQMRENKTEIFLDKPVGQGLDMWTGEEMMSIDSIKAQIKSGEDLKIILKSPGGSVIEGFAMADMLAAHAKSSTVEIVGTGIVGSIATMIFSSGTVGQRKLTKNAFFMIHKPSSQMGGTSEELKKEAAILDTMDDRLVTNYVDLIESNNKLINGSREETAAKVSEWMAAEKWFSAQEAVQAGLADGIAQGEYMTEQTAKSFAAMASHLKNTPAQFTNYIKQFEKPHKEDKNILQNFFNHLKSFFMGQTEPAQEDKCDDKEDEQEASFEFTNNQTDMKKEEMTKEDLLALAESMGMTLVNMEEEVKEEEVKEEEEKEEKIEMTKEEVLEMAKKMGMEEYKEKEAQAQAQTEQTNELKALKEELARIKAEQHKSQTNTLTERKEVLNKSVREQALDSILSQNDGFTNEIVNGLGRFFGK